MPPGRAIERRKRDLLSLQPLSAQARLEVVRKEGFARCGAIISGGILSEFFLCDRRAACLRHASTDMRRNYTVAACDCHFHTDFTIMVWQGFERLVEARADNSAHSVHRKRVTTSGR